MTETSQPVLELQNLRVAYPLEEETVAAVNGVDLSLQRGHTLGLVGETGAGKTSTALSLLRLVPWPGKVSCDRMTVNGKDVMQLSKKQLAQYRGSDIAMIFQDPMTALNPVFPVGQQIADAIRLHEAVTRRQAWERAEQLLEEVGISSSRASAYPHEFSGGMRQRVMIAIALACSPAVLIADEPTTALDTTIQAQILSILKKMRDERQMSMLLITHDLGVVADICDDVAVMYAGRIVEYGTLEDIFLRTAHPYTEGLFNSLPDVRGKKTRLKPIPGRIPDPACLPEGCAFAPRCPYAEPECIRGVPDFTILSHTHAAACSACAKPGFRLARRGPGREESDV
ncbi:MAG: ABC transporter ATP-binding protein [Clostridium sp.]|nr:ABC transporter ATP-binding protein [Clostridium sp.]